MGNYNIFKIMKILLIFLISLNCYCQEFSPQNLYKYIVSKGIKHPEIVYCQAILETTSPNKNGQWVPFNSKIFKENNNLFGMRYIDTLYCKKKNIPYRKTLAIGKKNNHAVYRNWKESVDDYLLWQKMFRKTPIHTEEQYYNLLHKWGYSESKRYVKVLKQIKNKEFP